MFKLAKLLVEDGKYSALPQGYTTRGSNLQLIKFNSNYTELAEKKDLDSIFDIEVGYQILLTSMGEWHRTSAIREIVSRGDDEIIFKTQTSVYKLSGKEANEIEYDDQA